VERVERYTDNSYEECRVAFLDVEHALDLAWAQRMGCDLRRLLHALPQNAEQASDIYADLLFSGQVDLLILDSIADMTPREEIEASANDQQQGLAARTVNKWVRRVTAGSIAVGLGAGRNRAPTQVWTNQLRAKIGQSYGDGLVEPGGKGQKFAAAVKIKFWTQGWKKRTLLDSLPEKEQIAIGEHVEVHWRIDKNKTGPARGEGMYLQIASGQRQGEIDEFNFLCHLAERYGILRQNEKKVWLLGDEEHKRKADAFDRMRQPHVLRALRAKLMARMEQERDA
jgi:recombination protein RecA